MTRIAQPPSSTRTIPRRSPAPLQLQRLAAGAALLFLEVEAGRRPVTQLRVVVSPGLYRRIVRRRTTTARPAGVLPGPTERAILSVFCQAPTDDVAEASVIIDRGGRVGALAVRLERRDGGWRAVELTAPEEGVPPGRAARRRSPGS